MNDKTFNELSQETPTRFHEKMLHLVRENVKASRAKMRQYYSAWDRQRDIFEGCAGESKEDLQAKKDDSPTNVLVLTTHAQVQTFIAFCFLVFFQRKRFFEHEGIKGNLALREVLESLMDHDLRNSRWPVVCYQFLHDVAVMGLGVIKEGWREEKAAIPTESVAEGATLEQKLNPELSQGSPLQGYEQVTTFEGNEILPISPYNFYPDPGLPITRHQDGRFCATDDLLAYVTLQGMEHSREVAGVEHIEPLTSRHIQEAGARHHFKSLQVDSDVQDSVVITDTVIKIIPADFEFEDGSKLGNETFPVSYMVWLANHQRVIKCEPCNNLHGRFNTHAAMFTPDQHQMLTKGLAELVEPMQAAISWFLNSRFAAVRRSLAGQLIIDPNMIDMRTVTSNSRVIKVKSGAGRAGVANGIKELQVQDFTTNHLSDMAALNQLVQQTTGVTEQAMGQFHTGRRSATEARGVQQGASARLSLIAKLIWSQAFEPCANNMRMNSRAFLSEETYNRHFPDKPELFVDFRSTPADIAASRSFFVFDGTLPSEKAFLAQSLQEVLALALSSPDAAVMLGIEPKVLFEAILTLRGVRNLDQFNAPDAQLDPTLIQRAAAANAAATAGGPGAGVPAIAAV